MPTKIEWCDETFNPRWGCTQVSPACANCYARTWDKRLGYDNWGDAAERRYFGPKHWEEPHKWNRRAEREGRKLLVFCASMADVFEKPPRPELEPVYTRQLEALGELIDETPNLIWLMLTKRPQNWEWAYTLMGFHSEDVVIDPLDPTVGRVAWKPPPNVFPMTTVEDQKRANERIPKLFEIPSALGHGVSAEPLLGPLDLTRIDITSESEADEPSYLNALTGSWEGRNLPSYRLKWIVAGGESGHNARPHNPGWFCKIRGDASRFSVPFLFKQHGEWVGYDHYIGDTWNTGRRFVVVDWNGRKIDDDEHETTEDPLIHSLVWAGKQAAGRLLDGVEHSEFPAAFGPRS